MLLCSVAKEDRDVEEKRLETNGTEDLLLRWRRPLIIVVVVAVDSRPFDILKLSIVIHSTL